VGIGSRGKPQSSVFEYTRKEVRDAQVYTTSVVNTVGGRVFGRSGLGRLSKG